FFLFLFFFFFQAEDGIRDFHVTGVQTCALPILASIRMDSFVGALDQARSAVEGFFIAFADLGALDFARSLVEGFASAVGTVTRRSEERRVGKERRTPIAADSANYKRL